MAAKFDSKPRQRDQTGAGKQPLNYYRSANAADGSPFESAKKKRPGKRRLFSKIADLMMILAILAAIGYSLMLRSQPKVELNTTTYHQASVYLAAAQNDFNNLRNRTKLTLDEKSIISDLQRQFPEISTGSIQVSAFGQTPIVKLGIAEPALLLDSQGASYIIDASGTAVAKGNELPQDKNLPTVIDQTGFQAKVGKQILSASEISFIRTILAQAQHAKVPVASVTLPAKAQEIDMRTKDQKYFVKFYLGGDPVVQAGQFLAARHNFNQTGHQPSQYLDVRVNGKIYYK